MVAAHLMGRDVSGSEVQRCASRSVRKNTDAMGDIGI